MNRFARNLLVTSCVLLFCASCGDDTEKKAPLNNVNNVNNLNNVNNVNNTNNFNNVNNANNANSTNNLNNVNNTNNVDTEFPFFLIRDTTETFEFCDVDDPGSDIIQMALLDGRGNLKGWANLWDDGILSDGNFFNLGLNIDGSAPAGINVCPEFNDDNVTSLGCGGYIVVEFVDSNGSRVEGQVGDQVDVLEFGAPYCDSGTSGDSYSVFACSDSGELPGSCTEQVIEEGTARSNGLIATEI